MGKTLKVTDDKQITYITRTCVAVAVFCICLMVFDGTAKSWSQNHLGDFDFLLYGALIPIVVLFSVRSFAHAKRNDVLFKIAGMPVRNRHMNRLVAALFFLVATFGVNHEYKIVQHIHLVATGLAIATAYTNMIYYYNTKVERYSALIGMAVGCWCFLFAFITGIISIAVGEALAAIPVIIWIQSST